MHKISINNIQPFQESDYPLYQQFNKNNLIQENTFLPLHTLSRHSKCLCWEFDQGFCTVDWREMDA